MPDKDHKLVDIAFWSKQPSFSDWQAAWLLNNLEPAAAPTPSQTVPHKIFHTRARVRREVHASDYETDVFGKKTSFTYTRQVLNDWVRRVKWRPKPCFLFPKSCEPALIEALGLHSKERADFIRTIQALIELLVQTAPGEQFRIGDRPNISAIHKAIEDLCGANKWRMSGLSYPQLCKLWKEAKDLN